MEINIENDINQLNSLLRGELSAVETYQQCIDKVDESTIVPQLKTLQESHRARAIMLKERVLALGGKPEQTSGVWGSFAKAVEATAGVVGTATAVSVLEEGEDHGLDDYRKKAERLSVSQRQFVEQIIYPEQRKSHDILRAIDARLD